MKFPTISGSELQDKSPPCVSALRRRLTIIELAALEDANRDEQELLYQIYLAYGTKLNPEDALQATTSPEPNTCVVRKMETKALGEILYPIMETTVSTSEEGSRLAEPSHAEKCEYALIRIDELNPWAREVFDPAWRAARRLEPVNIE